MSFKKKLKKALRNVIGDLSGIEWRDLDHKKVYGAIAALIAVVVLVIVLIVKGISGGNEETPQDVQDPVAVTEDAGEEAVEEAGDENPLELDAYKEINDLVFRYFYGRCMGDIAMMEEVVDVITEEEIQTIERKKDYVEAYKDIQCYTKKGLEEGSYVVFAAYEMKIYDIESTAPGIEALYVCTAEDGSLYIFNGEASEELTNYVLELAAEEDVAAVIADVDTRYKQLVAEDEELGKFAQTVLEAQQDTPAEGEAEAPATGESAKELEEPVSTTVNDGIRIRAERSTESRMLGTITAGTAVEVYANYEDGWSKISYSGLEGYCKTEFLESTEGVPMLREEEASEETSEEAFEEIPEDTDGTAPVEASVTTVNKLMQFAETVRIRADRSTDSERIATGYTSELVTVFENYSDGWSKIDYNGTIGYCKTEYLEEAE